MRRVDNVLYAASLGGAVALMVRLLYLWRFGK
jgi:enterochelin esterase-like enzyme